MTPHNERITRIKIELSLTILKSVVSLGRTSRCANYAQRDVIFMPNVICIVDAIIINDNR